MPIRSRETMIGAWAFLIGIVLSITVGLIAGENINQWILGVLSILGLIVGYFVSEKDSKTFLLAAVSLVIVSFAGIQGLVLSAALVGIDIGRLISSTLGALLVLFVPAAIVVSLKTVFAIARN